MSARWWFQPSALHRVLILNALMLAATISAGAVSILVLHTTALAVSCLILGLIADEGLLYWLLSRDHSGMRAVEALINPLLATLETQGGAISQQQHEITGLRLTLLGRQVRRQVSNKLDQQVKPDLAALLDRLEQVEASLPETLPQTRAWVARTRQLAAATQAHGEALDDDLSW